VCVCVCVFRQIGIYYKPTDNWCNDAKQHHVVHKASGLPVLTIGFTWQGIGL